VKAPKNQHWVPQFYLREFAVPETTRAPGKEKVWIFSRRHDDDLETKRVNIRNVAAENFLYSPLQKDGTRSFEGEHMLAEVDSALAQIWPRIANGFVDFDSNQGIRRGLAWFMALLLARHPDQMEASARMHEQMLRVYESAPKDELGGPKISGMEINGKFHEFDNSDWESYRDADESDIRRSFVENIRGLTIALTEDILNKKWAVVFSPRPVFVTSDRPVYMMHSNREHFGARTPGTSIMFPLSPTRVIMAYDHTSSEMNKYVHLRRNGAVEVNTLTWVHARRFLISHFEPTTFLAEMMNQKEKFERIQANANRVKTLKIGRNERCPCHSGKKFKDCCGRP
jgi:hypothetical protein